MKIYSLIFSKKIRVFFTLIEMVVTLAVFLVLIAIVLTFYNNIFKATDASKNNSDVFSNARVAMDVIGRDIQCIFYKNSIIPFWHKGVTGDGLGEYDNDLLAFISSTPLPQSDNIVSALCEVKYQLANNEFEEGWLQRSVTGDDTDSWNFEYNFNIGESGTGNAFTANNDSSSDYISLIPFVRSLNFLCYNEAGEEIYPTGYTSITSFPYSIKIILTLIDRVSWDKYKSLKITDEAAALAILNMNERTFTRTIFIGERGQ